MTEQETIELGEYSEALFKQQHFTTLVKLCEEQLVHDFLNTGDLEKTKREAIYSTLKGFREFMGLMRTIVDMKNEALKKNEPALSEDTDALPQEIDD